MESTDYTQMVETRAEQLFKQLSARMPSTDLQQIRKAYEFARKAHAPQRRKSGEPYIIHPLSVAEIVAGELNGDATLIIGALLHDVVEDTEYTLDDIRSAYGDDVASLVDVVTKRKKQHYEQSKQVDNYRQILESVKYDTRALLIKLADRLHNMRTLDSMRADKQMKIAGETDYFYAPLANRLGLYRVKTELENLSFRYRCPREYEKICQELEQRKKTDRPIIDKFIQGIEKALADKGLTTRTEVVYREPYSIRRKMQAKHCDFQHIDDLHYVRIIFPDNLQVSDKEYSLRIYAAITDCFRERPGSVSNYIDNPKENGYQSFHFKVLNVQGSWEEVHIGSEKMIRNSIGGSMAGLQKENVQLWIEKFNSILQDIAHHSREIEFMDGVTSSFYNDDIMVFTPQGRGVILPKNASALDFAYEVHSVIGRHAKAARINGRLAGIDTILQRGDCVEVITDQEVDPEPEWLSYVKTYKAKRHLRTYLSHQPRLPYHRCSQCQPIPGDEVIGFRREDSDKISIHKRACPVAVRLASQQGDSIVDAKFEENIEFLYSVTINIRGLDRYRLMSDIIDTITSGQHLSMHKLETMTNNNIVESTIGFDVHSVRELEGVMEALRRIDGVDTVSAISRD